jgi:hypothetical protein
MEKNFNDQELSDIMKEIEALEVEFSDEAAPKSEAMSVIKNLVEMDEEKTNQKTNYQEKVVNFRPQSSPTQSSSTQSSKTQPSTKQTATPPYTATSTAPTSMSFRVQGTMELELQFDIGGKTLALSVTQSGLSIELENGATFSIPITDADPIKKAV